MPVSVSPGSFETIPATTIFAFTFLDADGSVHSFQTFDQDLAITYAQEHHCLIRRIEADLSWNMITASYAVCPKCESELVLNNLDQRIVCEKDSSHYFMKAHTPMAEPYDAPGVKDYSQDPGGENYQ